MPVSRPPEDCRALTVFAGSAACMTAVYGAPTLVWSMTPNSYGSTALPSIRTNTGGMEIDDRTEKKDKGGQVILSSPHSSSLTLGPSSSFLGSRKVCLGKSRGLYTWLAWGAGSTRSETHTNCRRQFRVVSLNHQGSKVACFIPISAT